MCKCNCCGHAEVLDQSEDYRKSWGSQMLDSHYFFMARGGKGATLTDLGLEIGEATEPWTTRLTQGKQPSGGGEKLSPTPAE